MKKIVECSLIKGSTPLAFHKSMNAAIKDGWQPFGSISTLLYTKASKILKPGDSSTGEGIQYTQAIVKYEA